MSQGLLLLNLGTPDAPTTEKVRAYLKEFLMDPYVIDIAFPFRWLLVNGLILPRRPAKSAEAYQKVWTERGSPLLEHLYGLVNQVQNELGEETQVIGCMRYGKPTIQAALETFKKQDITDVTVLPLYPQYSLAASESSIVRVKELAAELAPSLKLKFAPAFYEDAGFLDAFAEVARENLAGFDFEHMLFSFHGLPERQIKKTDRSRQGAHCLQKDSCCDVITDANRNCYRAQCYATARGLAERLKIPEDKYTVCFQSRLGRTPWIRPYTDVMYQQLAGRGIKRIAVMCPAFVADCLETLEEVQIRGRSDFKLLGGEELLMVPSLNSTPVWAKAVADMARAQQRVPAI